MQEDICLLQKRGDEHVLTAAILCFPASWTLAEKFDRPLIGIHEPVDEYTDNIAARVQRLFNGLRAGRPLMRQNCLFYEDAALFQPRSMADRRDKKARILGYVRTERQCLLRLPVSDTVAFTIHTTVMDRSALSTPDASRLDAFMNAASTHQA